jgi:hypothetical protein
VLSTTVDDSQTSGTYRGLHLYILMISGGYFYDVRIDLVTLVPFGPVSQGIRMYISPTDEHGNKRNKGISYIQCPQP